MGLFTKSETKSSIKLEHRVVVEEISEQEYNRLIKWVSENIPSTERYTPNWNPESSFFNSQPIMGGSMEKITFKFRHEEQAMAFKLIL